HPRALHSFPTRRSSDLSFRFEHGEIALQCERCIEDAGAAAARFLGFARMRRAVRSKEELAAPGCGRLAQRQPVLLPLGDRQAVRSEEHTSELQSRENLV